jgi:drug/metabolite transporter (DMT)-like permease
MRRRRCWIASIVFETGHLDAIRNAPPLAWGEVLFGALIGAVLCFSLWYKLIMRVPADKILPFLLLMPATESWRAGSCWASR